tara:strand:+ start:758 stop:1396 length:639 start_codon:yes stop_codon:yes gene_type:complete
MINIIMLNEKDHNTMIHNFLKTMKIFNFSIFNINENVDEKNLINCFIIPENFNLESFDKIKIVCNKYSRQKSIFFIPFNFEKEFNKVNLEKIILEKIHYPIKVDAFENKLNLILSSLNISYLHLSLDKNNFLVNNLLNKKVFLTESEAEIVRLIFLKKIINKDAIKAKVLKLSPEVESKSLETHLYRLRKKFNKISSEISISSIDDNNLKIN